MEISNIFVKMDRFGQVKIVESGSIEICSIFKLRSALEVWFKKNEAGEEANVFAIACDYGLGCYENAEGARELILGTVEGQHFVHWAFNELLHVDRKLDMKLPEQYGKSSKRFIEEYKNGNSTQEDGKWEALDEEPDEEYENAEPLKEIFGIETNGTVVYTLRLKDKFGTEFYYVGRSKSILNRLTKHISQGGDFRKPEVVGEETRIVEIVSLQEHKEITEKARYDELCADPSIPSELVCGGK